jgi:hypothetical protein
LKLFAENSHKDTKEQRSQRGEKGIVVKSQSVELHAKITNKNPLFLLLSSL